MVESLSKWIRKLITSSSIERLLIREEHSPFSCKILKFDSLVYHLTAKHASTLRVLSMQTMFISMRVQKDLFALCTQLEVLSYTSGKTTVVRWDLAQNLVVHKKSYFFFIVSNPSPSLRGWGTAYRNYTPWSYIPNTRIRKMEANLPMLKSQICFEVHLL
jgi:hypothetical protein